MTADKNSNKKKPADESGLKTIFLEENSGDRCNYADAKDMCLIVVSDTRHQPYT
jgi:hypothetical protein